MYYSVGLAGMARTLWVFIVLSRPLSAVLTTRVQDYQRTSLRSWSATLLTIDVSPKNPNPLLYGWNVNFNEMEVKIVQPRPNIAAAKKGGFITAIVVLWFSSSITFSFIFKENSPESITFYSTWYILCHIVPLRMNTVSRKAFKHFVGRVINAESWVLVFFACFYSIKNNLK